MKKPLKKEYAQHPQTLGEHILKKRLESGMLQKDVARVINVSEDTITYWENGRTYPQVHHYPNIIFFLGYYPFSHETDSLAGKLKQLRFTLGYSYAQCGELFGVNGTTVRAWELNHNLPSRRTQAVILTQWNTLLEFVKISNQTL